MAHETIPYIHHETIDAFSGQALSHLLQDEDIRKRSLIYIPLDVSNGGKDAKPIRVFLQITRNHEKNTQDVCVFYAQNTLEKDYYRKSTAFQTISLLGRLGDWVETEVENTSAYRTEYYTKSLPAKTFEACKNNSLPISRISHSGKEAWEKTSTLDDAKTFFDTGISLLGMGAVLGVALLFIFPPVQPFVVGIFALAGLVALGFALGNYIMHKMEQKKAAVATVEIIGETSEEESAHNEDPSPEHGLTPYAQSEAAPLILRRHSDVSLGRSPHILMPAPIGTSSTPDPDHQPDNKKGPGPQSK